MECRMDGRVALITGGSRGLGRDGRNVFKAGAKRHCARRPSAARGRAGHHGGLGWFIGLPRRCRQGGGLPTGGRCRSRGSDLSTFCERRHVRARPVPEQTDDARQADFAQSVRPYPSLRLVIPGMQQRRWGRIINVLNTGAKAPRAEGAPTQVSRATGMALTKVLANEFARDNILVNALLTGSIVTDQVANRYKREQPPMSFEDYIANIGKGIPIGRMGTAQEYANLACFLASDAGSYVTGTAINLDGGACPVV